MQVILTWQQRYKQNSRNWPQGWKFLRRELFSRLSAGQTHQRGAWSSQQSI